MRDSVGVKEYLRVHGVDNVIDLSYEELKQEYEKTIRENISYYYSLFDTKNHDSEFLESILNTKKRDVIDVLKQIQTIDEVYEVLYEFLHVYSPTDLVAFMAELKMPVSYTKLQKIIAIVYARVQDEILDSLKSDLENLPSQERETLIAHYEKMKNDITYLTKLHTKYQSPETLDYLRLTAETKLNIMQEFLSKDLETEYKPFYDNTKEKRTLVAKILEISGIYSKSELLDMKIADLQVTYDEIMQQVLQREREQKLMRRYIEIFEDSAGITEEEFKSHCNEMQAKLSQDTVGEIISHFTTLNHFIANKINNVLSGKSMNKQMSPSALMGDT